MYLRIWSGQPSSALDAVLICNLIYTLQQHTFQRWALEVTKVTQRKETWSFGNGNFYQLFVFWKESWCLLPHGGMRLFPQLARWDWVQVRCFVQVSITNSFDSASGEENILLLDVDNAIDTTIIIICSTLSTFQRKMSWREVKREALTLHKDIASFRTWCGRASCWNVVFGRRWQDLSVGILSILANKGIIV